MSLATGPGSRHGLQNASLDTLGLENTSKQQGTLNGTADAAENGIAPDTEVDLTSTGESTPYESPDQAAFEHDTEQRNAYFDYASERSLRHTESKLFYQHHQLGDESQNSLKRSRTLSSLGGGGHDLSRTASAASRRSGRTQVSKDVAINLPPSPNLELRLPSEDVDAHLDAEDQNLEVVLPEELDVDHDIAHLHRLHASPEMTSIALNIKRILDLRRKYINASLQAAGENPKDDPERWEIYPPPPNPTWDNNKTRPYSQSSTTAQVEDVGSPSMRRRKPGQDIGEDFDMNVFEPLPPIDNSVDFRLDSCSIYQVSRAKQKDEKPNPLVKVPTLRDFYKDMNEIQDVSSDGPTKSFAYRQLDILEGKFHLHSLINSYQETADCKRVPRQFPRSALHLSCSNLTEATRSRFLQREKSRHACTPLGLHESETPFTVH